MRVTSDNASAVQKRVLHNISNESSGQDQYVAVNPPRAFEEVRMRYTNGNDNSDTFP